MNKNSLLLALIAGTAPLIAQEKPSQVLESLMQPLPSVAANIQARAAAFPALRQVPSSACAFVCMADVQGNITKLLNSNLLMAISKGESEESIAKLPPIESIAIAFEQGAEPNIAVFSEIINNFGIYTNKLNLLTTWEESVNEEYQASLESFHTFTSINAGVFLEDINKAFLNIPEMRIVATMKPGNEALMVELKQQFDTMLAKQGLPIPSFNYEGYTVISLPLAMAAAMIPDAPKGSMDAIIRSQHYLAIKFEGNCISAIYSRDLKKISAPSSIEQSMLASDKLKLSDARLKQGIVGCSFANAELINLTSGHDQYTPCCTMLKTIFQSLAVKYAAQAPVFNAAASASEQVRKQLCDIQEKLKNQSKFGNYLNVIWSNDKLNYAASYDYPHSGWNYKPGKVHALNQIDQADTISYLSVSPINTMSVNFDYKEFMQNTLTIGKGVIPTLNEKSKSQIARISAKIKQYRGEIKTAYQALCDINNGTEGSITIYADNKGNSADICNSHRVKEILSDGKAPRATVFSAISDKDKLEAGVNAMTTLCKTISQLDDKYIVNDKFVCFGNSAALNQSIQSSLSQTPSNKDFAGLIIYFNAKAIAPLIKNKEVKENLLLAPEIFSVIYPKGNQLIQLISIK